MSTPWCDVDRVPLPAFVLFFFFNDTATTEIYTLSLHDALPICEDMQALHDGQAGVDHRGELAREDDDVARLHHDDRDRKSTRLNSSHGYISYAVFCLKKKKQTKSGVHRSVSPATIQ